MMIEATAMTSADPVDITAMRIRNSIAYSPVEPRSFWATNGAASPRETSESESKGAPWALLNPRYANPMVVAKENGIANQVKPPVMKPQTPLNRTEWVRFFPWQVFHNKPALNGVLTVVHSGKNIICSRSHWSTDINWKVETYLQGFSSHRALPIGLVAKHCPEITNYINDSKHKTTYKKHPARKRDWLMSGSSKGCHSATPVCCVGEEFLCSTVNDWLVRSLGCTLADFQCFCVCGNSKLMTFEWHEFQPKLKTLIPLIHISCFRFF